MGRAAGGARQEPGRGMSTGEAQGRLAATTPPVVGGGQHFSFVDTNTCKLLVPATSVDAYKSATAWKDFYNIESGINDAKNESTIVKDSYSIDGRRTNSNHRGLTIQRTNDGKTRKVIVR